MKQAQLKIALVCAMFGIALILFFNSHCLAGSIREVKGTSRSLISIQTALGFSTILEFPTKPLSAVLGDQDGFKLEYVGNSITLKPIVAGSKSNLFVFTDAGRFNFSIQSGTSNSVDYIVTIKTSDDASKGGTSLVAVDPYRILKLNKKTTLNKITLTITQVKIARDAVTSRTASLIEFELGSLEKPYQFQASSIGVMQGQKYLDLESIYLDQLNLTPAAPVHGVIALLNQDWNRRLPISVIFAISKPNKKTKHGKIRERIIRVEVTVNLAAQSVTKKGGKNGSKNGIEELYPKAHP